VQHLYIRRRFFGWGIQLGLSEGLLLSISGLAIALLLYTTASSAAADMKWKATSSLTPISLAARAEANSVAPLILLAREPRHYWVATTIAYQGLAIASPAATISEPETSFGQASQAPSATVKATVQRSWTIIKLAFR
jgi:hypothetical protein